MKPLFEYLRHFATVTPNKPAIIYYGNVITYKELNELSDRFAAFLLKKGVRKGDKVALFMQNCPQYLICSYGIQKIGAIVGPCSPMFKEWELEYEVNDLGAKVIVALDHLYPVVEKIRSNTSLAHVVVTNYKDFLPDQPKPAFPDQLVEKKPISETHDLMDILAKVHGDLPDVDIDVEDDVCLIVYTSGSTGMPKGAMLTYRNAQFKTDCVTRTYGYTADDIHLCVMPVFHIAGQLFSANAPIYSGGTIVLLTRYTPEAVMEAIERYKVTTAYTVVPMNVEIMNHSRSKDIDFSSLKLNPCTSFGIQLTKEISDAWRQLTNASLFEISYGLSETHTGDSLMPPDQIKFGSHGKPTFDTEVRIVSLDDPTIVLPPGEAGEITVKGPGVFKGYLNKPEATEATLRNGWVHTGDIGMLDEEGYLYFQGRKKEMIKCSGYSVFPEEVEQMLIRHPAVSAAAVIGVPDPVRGESVKAFIVLNQGYEGTVTEEEIIRWSKEKMANYKYPRYVEFRNTLPATGTGKLLRRVLADEEKQKREMEENRR
jgi:long-chain acyl-CoA synthetase